jgi:8-oxo-dGTP diphosphatase
MSTKPRRKYCYEYPRPALTVDIFVLSAEPPQRVLLIRRKHDPFAGRWALPGGFVDENESLDAAARRELLEETGLEAEHLEQLHTFGDPGRDPRGHTVSVVYLTQVDPNKVKPAAADDAAEVQWFPLRALPPLAFDHDKILALVRRRVKRS